MGLFTHCAVGHYDTALKVVTLGVWAGFVALNSLAIRIDCFFIKGPLFKGVSGQLNNNMIISSPFLRSCLRRMHV
jgi:hypothetical protein